MRLTNDIRDNIRAKILNNVPTINYKHLLWELVQNVIVEQMDPKIRAVYDDEALRPMLVHSSCMFRIGTGYSNAFNTRKASEQNYAGKHPGLLHDLDINMDPRAVAHTKKGSLYYAVMQAALKTGYVEKYFEQQELLESVRQRVRSTLAAVTTVAKLYDALEPEFHHLIPREDDKKIQLPSTVAPFAEDLRKLGANLPKVPKVKKSA